MPRSTGACKPIEDQPMEEVADEAAEPAATARGRGRAKGCNFQHRVKTVKFDVDHAVALMHPVASNMYHPS